MNQIRIGEPGAANLRAALQLSDNPSKVLADFQASDGALNVSSVIKILPLLELLKIPSSQVGSGLVQKLTDELISSIPLVGNERIVELLRKCYPYFAVSEIRPVVIACMESLPTLPDEFLLQLSGSPSLVEKCPLKVKKQIWEQDFPSFFKILVPLFEQYIKQCRDDADPEVGGDNSAYSIYYSWTKRNAMTLPADRRKKRRVIGEILSLIGDSMPLYNTTVSLIKRQFLNTGLDSYCSIRTDLIMAAHDAESNTILSHEPWYKLARRLDTFIKEDTTLDEKKLADVSDCFVNVGSGYKKHMLADAGMLLYDPHVLHFLLISIIRKMEENVVVESDTVTQQILLLLSLAVSTRQMLHTSQFTLPLVDRTLLRTFIIPLSSKGSNTPLDIIQTHPLAWKIVQTYVVCRVHCFDIDQVEVLLPATLKALDVWCGAVGIVEGLNSSADFICSMANLCLRLRTLHKHSASSRSDKIHSLYSLMTSKFLAPLWPRIVQCSEEITGPWERVRFALKVVKDDK